MLELEQVNMVIRKCRLRQCGQVEHTHDADWIWLQTVMDANKTRKLSSNEDRGQTNRIRVGFGSGYRGWVWD